MFIQDFYSHIKSNFLEICERAAALEPFQTIHIGDLSWHVSADLVQALSNTNHISLHVLKCSLAHTNMSVYILFF